LPLRYRLRHVHLDTDVKIATLSRTSGQPALAETKSLSTLRSRRHFQPHAAFQSRHFYFGPERGLPRRDLQFVDQIASFDGKIGMSGQTHTQKQIAAFSTACSSFALAGQPDALTFVNAARNLDLVTFCFV